MKYIVTIVDGKEAIFTFPRSIAHDRFAEGIGAIRFGSEQNWNRKLRLVKPIAAGFIDNGICHGASESLKLNSRGEVDTALLSAR